ncbi:stress-induced-phosphoprotein [Plakobranchus ocellatus]|uniref:Stress-induced-phosphoprotein n=1 Tax=Plakobranchus ocellatus TaxID=259542 RepID=A0AAV4DCS8_9GAST|nr:stress-induced-phosphoprotein [Plakobranchus ocellatus]
MKPRAEQCKEEGNRCMKEEKYTEAVIHYSEAVKHDPNSAVLHSNRSLAFLRLDQLYLAMEDAQQAIKLEPNWPKGFYRKGEIEFKAGHYQQALVSYKKAMIRDPNDSGILSAISKTNKEMSKDKKDATRTPIIYTLIGLIVGVVIVLADQFLTKKPAIQYLVLQVLLVAGCGGIGFIVAKIKRYITVSQRESLLEEPLDLLKEMGEHGEEPKKQMSQNSNSHTHHSQAAGRQRMRKGKS